MASKPRLPAVVVDSCVLIDCLDNSPPVPGTPEQKERRRQERKQAARQTEAEARAGQLQLAISTVAIAEFVYANREAPPAEQDELIEQYLRHSWFEPRSVTRSIANCARRIRRDYPMFAEDAIHVATALVYKIPELLTTDGDSDKDDSAKKRANKWPLLAYDGKISWEGGKPLIIRRPADRIAERARDASEAAEARGLFHGAQSVQGKLEFPEARGEAGQ